MANVVHTLFTADSSGIKREAREAAVAVRESGKAIADSSVNMSRGFDRTRTSVGRLGGIFSTVLGTVGFGGLALGLKDAQHGAIQLQVAQNQLKAALQSTGAAGAAAYQSMFDSAEKLSTSGGFTTDENLKALAAFTRETHSASEATKLLSLTTNIARGRGVDLATAQMMVQRGYGGSIGRLQALLGPMVKVSDAQYNLTQAHQAQIIALSDEAATMGKAGHAWLKTAELQDKITPKEMALAQLSDKHATAQEILAAATTAFGGATAKYAKTTAGQLDNTRHAVANLQASVGKVLLPVINFFATAIAKVTKFLDRHRAVLWAVVAAVAAVSSVLVANAAVMAVVDAKNVLLSASNRILKTSFNVATTAADEQAVSNAHLSDIKKILFASTTTNTIALQGEAAATTEATGATDALAVSEGGAAAGASLLDLALSPLVLTVGAIALGIVALGVGIYELVKHFKAVKDAVADAFGFLKKIVGDVVGWIGSHWKLLLQLIPLPFIQLPALIIFHFGQITSFLSGVVSFIGHIFATVGNAIAWPFKWAWNNVIHPIFNAIVSAVRWVAQKVGSVFHFISHDTPLGALGQLVTGHVGGALHALTFGLLQEGGVVRARSNVGPPPGSTDKLHGWLTPGEGVLNRTAMNLVGGEAGLNAINNGQLPGVPVGAGSPGSVTINPSNVYVRLDSRTVAQAVIRWTLQKAARGPSSLSGGSLVTGTAGSIDVSGLV